MRASFDYFEPSGKKLRMSLAAASVTAILELALYRLGAGDDGTSQPRSTTGPWKEPALQLNAVMVEGGKPLTSEVREGEVHQVQLRLSRAERPQ